MISTSLKDLPEESVSHNPEIKKKVMLRFGDLPYLTNFSQARFAPGQSAPGHAHQDMCEVFFVEAGSGVISIDGKENPLLPGTCVAVELGEVHEIVNTGSTELVLTYFGLQVEAENREKSSTRIE
ncbi:cupin domain-containing protein [Komarekiella sp. 'clone 1']|uniref:Cupin domain-containing protein n=1 Tax=Komarekiella delphini-convector SJRDD-AB1 TaxID=2593771 RepID=A0AA40VRM4_9NOST|nr:cupin domain-containing protein [Komarekiella delphini-convector]MBD6616411.1 cupin domain-containing protein [Komarekiella delphini-convector SJRDD-AB1]